MKIGFISDTHGSVFYLKKALSHLQNCDILLHAGDILSYGGYQSEPIIDVLNDLHNIFFVRGNTDRSIDFSFLKHEFSHDSRLIQLQNLRIFMTHGDIAPFESLFQTAKKENAAIFVYGHTHRATLMKKEGCIILNPGSTSYPRNGIHSCSILEHDFIKLIDIETGDIFGKMKFHF